MAHDLNPTPRGDFGSLAINNFLLERPALIGEFSLAYEAFRETTIADLAPVTKDRKSTRLNSSHSQQSRMPSSA